MERVYSRGRYIGKERKLEECGGINKGIEVRQQEEIEKKKKVDEYRRMELPGKYMAKLLYEWDDKKFEEEYLKKLEKNWKKWKGDRQIDESEHLKMIEEKMEEENKKIRRRDWRTGYFSRREILKRE